MVVPALTTVIVVPTTVATAVLELEYTIDPVLLDVGATKLNDASPNVFAGTEKPVIVGVPFSMVRVAVIVPLP